MCFLSSGQSKVKALLLSICENYSQILQTPEAETPGLRFQGTPTAALWLCTGGTKGGLLWAQALCVLGLGLLSAATCLQEESTAFNSAVVDWDLQKPGHGDLSALIYESIWAGP